MYSRFACYLLIISSVLSTTAYTAVNFQNINQLLDHVETLSPEIQKAKANLEVISARRLLAAQIPNPELTVGNWAGKANSRTWKQTDITVLQPVELGGKRGSRINVAEAEAKESQVQLLALTAEARLKVLFTLYRMRQLSDEISILSEAKSTFDNLVNNYKRRPQLSPEQSTSVFVFDLTEKEYELLLEDAQTELNFLESDFKVMTGIQPEDVKDLLPKRLQKWPVANGVGELNSPTIRVLSARTELSEQEMNLAKSEIWPTVSIGPSYTMQNQFGEQANILGVVVSLPLPILNQNNGARAIAAKSIIANRKFMEVEKTILGARRFGLIRSYTSSSKVLEAQWNQSTVHKDHERVEQNFLKGLISSSLVIESHRQYVDAQRLYHSRELKALDYYYQLLLLEGGKIEGISL